ncbi:MAG: UdgX family uracil-DNA binding protein [Gaiellales bacterium]|jgi:DNA polymerase|nr:UdgX family uracil-DNA binding protein [Gaiellales bacterium]
MSATEFLPERRDLESLRRAAAGCKGCALWREATQTVFGEGPADAPIMLLGEQPGDQEDRQGRPFVGPAGRLLDRALESAKISRDQVYATNSVKHFKWEARGKRRIHKTPGQIEIVACQPWFAAELEALGPQILVLLGAVAAKSVFGGSFRVTRERGGVIESPAGVPALATVHPSSVLRARDADRERAMEELVRDLRVVQEWVAARPR